MCVCVSYKMSPPYQWNRLIFGRLPQWTTFTGDAVQYLSNSPKQNRNITCLFDELTMQISFSSSNPAYKSSPCGSQVQTNTTLASAMCRSVPQRSLGESLEDRAPWTDSPRRRGHGSSLTMSKEDSDKAPSICHHVYIYWTPYSFKKQNISISCFVTCPCFRLIYFKMLR